MYAPGVYTVSIRLNVVRASPPAEDILIKVEADNGGEVQLREPGLVGEHVVTLTCRFTEPFDSFFFLVNVGYQGFTEPSEVEVLIAEVQVNQGETSLEYHDGSQAGYHWEGEAWNSRTLDAEGHVVNYAATPSFAGGYKSWIPSGSESEPFTTSWHGPNTTTSARMVLPNSPEYVGVYTLEGFVLPEEEESEQEREERKARERREKREREEREKAEREREEWEEEGHEVERERETKKELELEREKRKEREKRRAEEEGTGSTGQAVPNLEPIWKPNTEPNNESAPEPPTRWPTWKPYARTP